MTNTSLVLSAGLDRSLAWREGGSVRYLVADLSARSTATGRQTPPLNLALCVDVSGSMGGDKIAAARNAAIAVVGSMTERDCLSIVAFDDRSELLLDARNMDANGHAAAIAAIHRLEPRGSTNLFEGWLQAAERVAAAMALMPDASPRVLLLSDGHANRGLVDSTEIAVHVGALLERGVLTSALGIGDGYDENLLGAIAAAGGGNLHDAVGGAEVSEVVLGEIHEGRNVLLERTTLRVSIPAGLRGELVGPWAHTAPAGAFEVTVGTLLPDQTKRVVIRLYCPTGTLGTELTLDVSADGEMPGGGTTVEAVAAKVGLRFASGSVNNAQPRDLARSLAIANAWQAEVVRKAVIMNREGDYRAARSYIERELRHLERFARGVPGTEPMLRDLILVQRSIHEEWDERTRKEVSSMSMKSTRSEREYLSASRMSLSERFTPSRRQP